MKTRSFVSVLIAFSLSVQLSVAGEEQGGRAASFLQWGAGSKAIALGKTFTGIADDGAALLWNPAGVSQLKKSELLLMHAIVFEDRQVNFAAMAYPLPGISLSAAWMQFGVTNIQERDTQGQLIGQFNDAENLFLLGAGMNVVEQAGFTIRAGLAGRYFYHSLYTYHGSGFGLDVGGMFDYGLKGVMKRVGISAVVQNIGASLKWNTESSHQDAVPLCTRLGAVAEMSIIPLLLAADLEKNQDQDMRIHAGAQYTWQILSLRIGLNNDKLTAGAGVTVNLDVVEIGVDYAYTTDEISDSALHFFSLRGRF